MFAEEVMPPIENREITYEIRMKKTGPFRYFVPDLTQFGPQWHEKRIRELLGRHNIRALSVEKGEDWMLIVVLELAEPSFAVHRTIFGQPTEEALAEVRSYLPRRHCESVSLLLVEHTPLFEY